MRLLALFWIALGMSAPVSAWAVHNTVHSVAQVNADAHHHHDDDGRISVHEHESDANPDGGHDHSPSMLLSAATVPDAHASVFNPMVLRQTYAILTSRGMEHHPSNGLRRPPRIG
jgi:hypothetical protein